MGNTQANTCSWPPVEYSICKQAIMQLCKQVARQPTTTIWPLRNATGELNQKCMERLSWKTKIVTLDLFLYIDLILNVVTSLSSSSSSSTSPSWSSSPLTLSAQWWPDHSWSHWSKRGRRCVWPCHLLGRTPRHWSLSSHKRQWSSPTKAPIKEGGRKLTREGPSMDDKKNASDKVFVSKTGCCCLWNASNSHVLN